MKKITKNTVITLVMMIAAIGLLLGGTIGGARAALIYSETYVGEMAMKNIGVALNENGKTVEGDGALLTGLLGEGEKFIIGKEYDEELTITNTGDIDEYVRMSVYKYWSREDGKEVELDPELIKLTFATEGWVIDEDASTEERTILYYTEPLAPGETTEIPAVTKISTDSKLQTMVTQTETVDGDKTTITTTYKYDGYQIGLKAEVDGVQTHNKADAILSAWGVDADALGIE